MPDEVQFFNLHEKPELVKLINEALSNGQYKSTANDMPEFTFEKIDGRTYEQTTIPLYTYAYLPEETIEKVEYILDGSTKLAECTQIPYKYSLTTEQLTEGRHTLTVTITGSSSSIEREYSITRSGSSVEIN
jgi:hypothetical protein